MRNDTLILVLDDDPDICSMIKMMLEYNDYRVVTAENETVASATWSSAPVDLLIMDMLLSGSDGTDICRRLKQDKKTSAMPVLMFSAHPHAREACLAAGADDFIAKPFEINDLLGRIGAVVQKKEKKQDQ